MSPRAAAVCALVAGFLSGCDTISLPDWGWWPWSEPKATREAATSTDQRPVAEAGGTRPAETAIRGRESIVEVQTALTELGYAPGPVDGIMGPLTRGAIRRFQADAGRPADGRISADLVSLLESASKPASSAGNAARTTIGPPPAYDPGTRFVYAGGEVEAVVEVTGPWVRWQSNRGVSFTTYHSFILPPLAWRSAHEAGRRSLDAKPSDLWPLKPGEEVSFTASTRVRYGERPDNVSAATETWRCRFEGTEKVTVIAGTFDARRIACERRLEPPGPRLRRVWHYAPEIRHYVLREDMGEAAEAPRRAELLAVQPDPRAWPPAARAGLGWALEHALDSAASGKPTVWNSSAVDTEVRIEAGAYVEGGLSQACRSFRQIWTGPRGRRVYPGVACRDDAGRWRIPGLASDVAVTAKASQFDATPDAN